MDMEFKNNQVLDGVDNAPTFDLEKKKAEVAQKIQSSPEIQNLVRQIDLQDASSILSFGKPATEEMSTFADKLLHQMEVSKVEDSGQMLVQLKKIMDKFDIKELQGEEKQGMFSKMFKSTKNSLEALFKKYHTMGDEVDKIYISIKQYETEIEKANKDLDELFMRNVECYEQLEKYIYAGELATDHIKTNMVPQLESKVDSGSEMDRINLENMNRVIEMMEQRVHDLKLAEHVALQGMPDIKTMQYSNYGLVRKINSAFIITMPIFKQCLVKTIMLKRQKVQAKSLSALDETTNELLLRNATATANQNKEIAKLTTGSSIEIETLEKTWETIVNGIDETKRIQEEAKQKREDSNRRLSVLKEDYEKKRYVQ
ncbi:toxic anion resistance protein [Clostridium sp. DL1XJH146]